VSVFRCDWCGRFYSSPLPEGSACRDHVYEHNERLSKDIERFNSRLSPAAGEAPRVDAVPLSPDAENKER
jgi:hypothetical protein